MNKTMEKIKIEIEYIINTSPIILFSCMSTPSGLSEWFANDVNIKDDMYTFFWERTLYIDPYFYFVTHWRYKTFCSIPFGITKKEIILVGTRLDSKKNQSI